MQLADKGTLLLVDDEPGILNILGKILEGVAGKIDTAAEGAQALEKLKTGQYDAVLCDINMPVLNGLDLLAKVRAMHMQTPFVFLTGYGDKEKMREAMRLGASDFLDKPFDPYAVIDVVRIVLELGQKIRTIEKEIETCYTSESIPEDMKNRLRKIKQAILLMRPSIDVYKK
ncbi:response regulator [Bdellovibrio sp. HCB337]|uniref:response regulator n=1 Tax=Bdellovibrio sp. HCB337 TaxID=3394358 RepID=UPI0039A5E088